MEIIKLFFFEYILGYAFQSCVYILGLFAFNKKKVEWKKFLVSALIFVPAIYVTRALPISFGVHTLLSLIILVLIGIWYLKFPIYPTIRATLFSVIVLLVGEFLNVTGLTAIYGKDTFDQMMTIPLQKAISGIPSSLFFACSIILFYVILRKRTKD